MADSSSAGDSSLFRAPGAAPGAASANAVNCATCCLCLGLQSQGRERKGILITCGVVVGVGLVFGICFGVVKLVHLIRQG